MLLILGLILRLMLDLGREDATVGSFDCWDLNLVLVRTAGLFGVEWLPPLHLHMTISKSQETYSPERLSFLV